MTSWPYCRQTLEHEDAVDLVILIPVAVQRGPCHTLEKIFTEILVQTIFLHSRFSDPWKDFFIRSFGIPGHISDMKLPP